MKSKLFFIVVIILLNHHVHAQLLHDYELNGNYLDAFGGNYIVPNGGFLNATEYVFDLDQGPNVSGVIDSASYSIEMRFTPSSVWGWHKILDFKNRTSESGLYIYDGQFLFYPTMWLAGPYVFESGQPATVQFSRNGATKQITGCVNGFWQWTLSDEGDEATFTGPNNIIQILMDDFGGSDPMAGSLDYFKIYDFNGIAFDLELGDTVFTCDPYVIDPGVTEVDFHWSDGSTGPTLTVTESGAYSLTISAGCFVVDIDTVEVIFEGVEEGVDMGPPAVTICDGESYIISLDPTVGDYTWQDGSISPEYTITTSGVYQVSFDDGCDITTDAISVWVTDLILPEITGVPGMVCENDNPVSLPIVQDGIAGNWSGPGITNNIFDPTGQDGNITISFTPDPGQCASSAEIGIEVVTCSNPPCEIPGYTFAGNYNGHSYFISESFTNWTVAKAFAESIGGHLATISDANENAFVVGIVDYTCVWDNAWIGLSDEDVEGTFVWVTGEPLIYTNWAPGNPGGSQQDYTEIFSSFYGGTWGDYESPPVVDRYIVEFESLTCDCDDPLFAGYSVITSICNAALPFNLIELLGSCGNPDPGGTWSPPLASGGNIYDPAIDGSGVFTYIVSSSDCGSDTASVTIDIIVASAINITGVPSAICELDNPISLPTLQQGVTGNWSGTGVTNNNFNPSGLNGIYILTFTPNPGQCALTATTDILVEPLINISVTGIPDSLCQFNPPLPLPTTQSGINGDWSGPGVSNNTLNPAGLNGNIVLTFIPDAGSCVLPANTTISVFQNLYAISGIPASICVTDPPIPLSPLQDGITGNWTGPGVSNNTFNPAAQNGMITLTFTPDAGQCALPVSQNILVNGVAMPDLLGLPSSLCQTDLPITLPPTEDGFNGSWSGQGVASNTFNPSGLSGIITLTFTPDAGQCAVLNTLEIVVNQSAFPLISGIPDTICEGNNPISLSSLQNGIVGDWTGPGVTNNIFNPDGQSGITILTFTPNANQCALDVQWGITIEPPIVPILSGIPSVLCQTDMPIDLPTLQNGFIGSWSVNGISNDTFNPNGWIGPITLFFNPNMGQCADLAQTVIQIDSSIIPLLSGIPNSLCEYNKAINLPTIEDGINGNWSGPGVSLNVFNPIGQSGNVMLAFTPDSGQCAFPDTVIISISTPIVPIITGVPASLCQYDSMLLLPGLQSGITGIWSGLNVNANTFSPSGLNGNYALTFSPVSGQCADTTTIQIAVHTPPSFSNLITVCDTISETYTVSFEITGGDPISYLVNGMPVNGTLFTSSPFSSDSIQYAFTLDDANGCGPVNILGAINCACSTYAGTMNFSGSPLLVCAGSDFTVSFNQDDNLDPDDLLEFILHDNAGMQLDTIYAISNVTTFTFPTGIILGHTYYVSAIAGSNDGNGNIDLNDQCLSVAPGVPVIFYQPQIVLSGGGEICPSECMSYTFNLAGVKPFEFTYQVNANGMVTDHMVVTDSSNVSLLVCPLDYGMTSGTIDIIPLTLADANCTVALSSFPGSQTIVHPATSSMISNVLCPGESLSVNGVVYNQSNPSGTEVITNPAGCDSIIQIDLTYYPDAVFELNQTLCFGGSLDVNGTIYDESNPDGIDTLPGSSIYGCDSIIYIHLAFDSVVTAELSSTLCFGESLIINGHTYDAFNPTGTELFPKGSVLGCDSTLNIELLFYPEAASSINPVLCPGEMIIVNGMVYDESHPSGTVVLPKASYVGCDSSIQINLAFYPEAIGTIADTLGAKDSIIVQGTVYNQFNLFGTEIIPGGSVTGCDSIIMITLFFHQSTEVKLYVPNVFSPNGDGVNDTWRIYSSDQKAELVSLSILDRWGGILYSCTDKLLNDSSVEWDGSMKGKEVGDGVYVFVAVIKTNDGASRQIKGDITVIR